MNLKIISRGANGFIPLFMLLVNASTAAASEVPEIPSAAVANESAAADGCETAANEFKYAQYGICLQKLADAGNTEAASRLVTLYGDGKRLVPNFSLTAKYAEIAIRGKKINGFQMLALQKAIGLGVRKSNSEALQIRRELAKIQGDLPPLHLTGKFTGYQVKESAVINVKVLVSKEGVNKDCRTEGQSAYLRAFACDVIMKYFSFLPGVSASGQEVDSNWVSPINFIAPGEDGKIDTTIN